MAHIKYLSCSKCCKCQVCICKILIKYVPYVCYVKYIIPFSKRKLKSKLVAIIKLNNRLYNIVWNQFKKIVHQLHLRRGVEHTNFKETKTKRGLRKE